MIITYQLIICFSVVLKKLFTKAPKKDTLLERYFETKFSVDLSGFHFSREIKREPREQ